MNYTAILLYKRPTYAENDSFELVFQLLNDLNTLQSDLSAFKFQAIITDDYYTLTKKDANYTDGADTQISVSADRVTVKVEADDTGSYEGTFVCELQMGKKADSTFRQTAYRGTLKIYEEELED